MSLTLEKYCFGYDEPLAPESNITLREHFCLPFLGLNGVGKTSFFKSFIDSKMRLSGSLHMDGSVSFLFQDDHDLSHWKVQDILLLKSSQSQTIWDRLGVCSWLDLKFGNLSDGMKSRVLLARVLCKDTDYFILDEPLSYLDEITKREVLKFFLELSEKGKSFLFSCHDWTLCREYFSEALWLEKEKALRVGSLEKI